MDPKHKQLGIDMVVAGCFGIAGGFVGSEVADKLSDLEALTTVVSAGSHALVFTLYFTPAHIYHNKDIYFKEGKFNWGKFFKNMAKLGAVYAGIDTLYYATRPPLQALCMKYVCRSAGLSSILVDLISFPLYFFMAPPAAKMTGIFDAEK